MNSRDDGELSSRGARVPARDGGDGFPGTGHGVMEEMGSEEMNSRDDRIPNSRGAGTSGQRSGVPWPVEYGVPGMPEY